jgi:hypothetical protein
MFRINGLCQNTKIMLQLNLDFQVNVRAQFASWNIADLILGVLLSPCFELNMSRQYGRQCRLSTIELEECEFVHSLE